jgi:hypothetical protein
MLSKYYKSYYANNSTNNCKSVCFLISFYQLNLALIMQDHFLAQMFQYAIRSIKILEDQTGFNSYKIYDRLQNLKLNH